MGGKLSESEQLAWIVTFMKWGTSFFMSLWVSADFDIKALAILAAADFVLSLFNPKVSTPSVCRRLGGTFIIVGTSHLIYRLAKDGVGLNVGFDVSALVSGFYCLGEVLAITRSCPYIGVQVPPAVLDFVSRAEGITGKDKQELIALKLKQDQEGMALNLKISQRDDDKETIIKP